MKRVALIAMFVMCLTGCGTGAFVKAFSADAKGRDPAVHFILRHDTAFVVKLDGVDTTAEVVGEGAPEDSTE